MEEKKIKLTKADRFKMFLRSYFLLSSFNYERMQNGGVAYTLIPAIKKLWRQPRRSMESYWQAEARLALERQTVL